MKRALGFVLLMAGAASFAMASPVPEVGAASAGSAIALVSGVLLIVRGRRK